LDKNEPNDWLQKPGRSLAVGGTFFRHVTKKPFISHTGQMTFLDDGDTRNFLGYWDEV